MADTFQQGLSRPCDYHLIGLYILGRRLQLGELEGYRIMICDRDDVVFSSKIIDELFDFVNESSTPPFFDHEGVHSRFFAKVLDSLRGRLTPQPHQFYAVFERQHPPCFQRCEFSQGMAKGI